MIFARYKGAATPSFVPGRTYLARQEMEGQVVCDDFVEVVDEDGRSVRVDPKDGEFEFLDEAYAVVTKKFNGFEAGEVVVATEASDDGRMLNVKGEGFCSAENVELLDGTYVRPGLVLMDSDGVWKKVARVDEALWVMTEGDGKMRSPEEFRFPVSHDGELMVEPLVTCLDGTGQSLTTGKRYYLLMTRLEDGMLGLKNDHGDVADYMPERFRMG